MAFKLAGNFIEKHVHVGMTYEEICEKSRNEQMEIESLEKEMAELMAETEEAEIVERE